MTTIYLIRHAQADGNLYRRCQSWYDSLVTPIGYQQIEALKNRFADTHFDAVYSSDLFRTMTTAKAICEPHNLPLITDPELREINCGRWEDFPWGILLQQERESMLEFWRCDPKWQVDGSETFEEIRLRFDRAVKRIASRHPNQTIAIFAHGCIIRSTLAYWFGLPCSQIREVPHGDNTSVARLEYSDDSIRVCWYNNTDHLTGELAHAPHPAAETDEATAARIEQASVYFRPFDPSVDSDAYWAAYEATHHLQLDDIDRMKILEAAQDACTRNPGNLSIAMLNGTEIGLVELDTSKTDHDVGLIKLMYLNPAHQRRKLGVQLIGQAVSHFRALERQFVCVNLPDANMTVSNFFKKYGFNPSDQPGEFKKYIGY